jgi:hypothetical protein
MRKEFLAGWTLWHMLAFWAIWFAIASGISWIIIGGAIWRTLGQGGMLSPTRVAANLSRASTITIAFFWSVPVIVSGMWSFARLSSRTRQNVPGSGAR